MYACDSHDRRPPGRPYKDAICRGEPTRHSSQTSPRKYTRSMGTPQITKHTKKAIDIAEQSTLTHDQYIPPRYQSAHCN